MAGVGTAWIASHAFGGWRNCRPNPSGWRRSCFGLVRVLASRRTLSILQTCSYRSNGFPVQPRRAKVSSTVLRPLPIPHYPQGPPPLYRRSSGGNIRATARQWTCWRNGRPVVSAPQSILRNHPRCTWKAGTWFGARYDYGGRHHVWSVCCCGLRRALSLSSHDERGSSRKGEARR